MRLIDPGATYQLSLPSLELREQEIISMFQNNSMGYYRSKVFPLRERNISKFSCKKFTQVDRNVQR